MFNSVPKILSHISVVEKGNFVSPEYILNKVSNKSVNLLKRYCPHRMYPLHNIGEHVNNITCQFHKFKWDSNGIPINNNKSLNCGKANVGSSGLIYKSFIEPKHDWVKDLENEPNLQFSHCYTGSSKGSWLWMMEIQADLLHIQKNGIHPELSQIINLDEVTTDEGEDWSLQKYSKGWWLSIYPYTFIEYSKGCLAINYTIPHDKNNEFGFDWFTQFYFDTSVSSEKRINFEKYFHDVFLEDLEAIEKQKVKYFPLTNSSERLETHCIHFGQWYLKHLNKNN